MSTETGRNTFKEKAEGERLFYRGYRGRGIDRKMKKDKKSIRAVLILLMAGMLLLNGCSAQKTAEKKTIRIGVTLYRGDDAFINNIRSSLEEKAKEYEQQTGIKVNLEIMDPKGNQNTQNSQVDRFLSLEYDAICVNMVDRSAASYVINKAMDAGTPVVFFNREPVEEDMKRWEHLYYVGEDARESAVLQGKLLVDAYQENPDSLDLNGDGTVGYVILEGERSHQDSLIRTEWSVQTMRDGGIPLEKLTGGSANWDRSQAAALMEQWISQFGDAIEAVICNNDEMALGAAEAIERAGDTRGVKVVGIDGTPQGIDGLKSGKLYGTVQCDSDEYAEVIFEIAAAEALGQNVQEKVELEDGTYYQCSQKSLTASDLP